MFDKITLVFPDGKKKEFRKGATGLEVAASIGERLARDALAVKLGERTIELDAPLEESGNFRILTWNDAEGKKALWHTAAHVLNEAVQEVFPDALPAIGPPIDEGFYFDFDVSHPFTKEDLEKIEKKMIEIISRKEKVHGKKLEKKDAIRLFEKNPYKKELIEEFTGAGKTLTVYFTGKFADLCKGGHVSETGKIKAVKILKTSGAYWRGDQKNKSLQRIYGIAFPEKKMLDEYLEMQKKAAENSHLKLGKELDLFSMHEEAPGTVFFHPKGTVIYNKLMEFLRREQEKRNYLEVITPMIMKKKLWEQSGHFEHYKENMYFVEIDEEDFAVKPMNCPGHILIFGEKRRSYRELPLRIAEFGTVHRHELSGVLNGLFRVRKFTQDDAHIFASHGQLRKELVDVIDLTTTIYNKFGFEYRVELSTRPEKAMGSKEIWENATRALEDALKEKKINYKVNSGDGAFYGPKIDFHITDSLRRNWQVGTIQVDFSMPEKFGIYFINSEDKKETPVIVHRAIYGSLERFIGILVEHFGGSFPTWLAPVQAVLFPVSEKHADYARKIHAQLSKAGIRTELDLSNETVAYKVRNAQLQKTPFILTLGEKEEKNGTIAVRDRFAQVSFNVKLQDFLEQFNGQ
ncbi:MAG: threonine--tRNA ligase [Candidatus Diapherotrites archaeon]|nr:threonine--tRNA ligase [Candidatus Diapherotrites archaeon]